MPTYTFDESNIIWHKIEGFDQVSYYIYEVDEKAGNVDVLFKFAANQPIMLHQHKASYRTFVVHGELRIFRPNGDLKEVRPVGSYVISPANGEPHTESAGDEDAVILFSNRNIENGVYEFLDESGNVSLVLGMAEFKALFDTQKTKAL